MKYKAVEGAEVVASKGFLFDKGEDKSDHVLICSGIECKANVQNLLSDKFILLKQEKSVCIQYKVIFLIWMNRLSIQFIGFYVLVVTEQHDRAVRQ